MPNKSDRLKRVDDDNYEDDFEDDGRNKPGQKQKVANEAEVPKPKMGTKGTGDSENSGGTARGKRGNQSGRPTDKSHEGESDVYSNAPMKPKGIGANGVSPRSVV